MSPSPIRSHRAERSSHAGYSATTTLAPVPPSASEPFERIFGFGNGREIEIGVGALVLALLVHVGIVVGLATRHSEHVEQMEIIEAETIEKKEEKKEDPPPPPPPPPEPTAALPQNPNVAESKPTNEPPPPAAAKAGNLLTADDDKNQKADDTESFVTDPNGKEYGSGYVKRGGVADVGTKGGSTTGVPLGSGSGTPAKGPLAAAAPPPISTADLSRKVSVPENPCRGFFPSDADDDEGRVVLSLTVGADGKVQTATVISENPKGQGFGRQARVCFQGRKLDPALDRDGKPVGTTLTVNFKFSRS